MKIVCTWCEEEGKPGLIGEQEPVDDPSVVDGVCRFHHDWFVAQVDAATAVKR
jgi:hypothetical protein